jgi:Predicted DNA-binding protein with PD1-like DNA-binding motif
MDYRVGQIGRVFTVRMDHGEDLSESLKTLAAKENIQAATFVLLGAIEAGNLVVGPKTNERPPNKMWFGFEDAHEIVGVGNIFRENGEPILHLHAGLGRAEDSKIGCVRKENKIFMVIEAFVFELVGFEAERIWSDVEGYAPIRFK